MIYIHKLQDTASSYSVNSGGKGANLHKLIRFGFNVPGGFVINTTAFDVFLKENNIYSLIKSELSLIRVNNIDTISAASQKINDAILKAVVPKDILSEITKILLNYNNQTFSVRSSGVSEDSLNNSWAGQFDSFLKVHRDELELYIKKCWASFFNTRALSYNIKTYRDLNNLKFAVVIQEMVLSEKSGIAFSIDPKENDSNKIIIEASQGLGEELVSGKAIPFSVIIDKKEKIILRKSIESNQYLDLLSVTEINFLFDQIIILEKLFKTPVDIEWAFAKNKFYFLQIRPITGLERKAKDQKKNNTIPNINNYELTFKASGLSFIFTDILSHGYKYLNPLYTSSKQQFCQYISKDKIEYATKFGITWLSDNEGFNEYENIFSQYYNKQIIEIDNIINSKNISKSSVVKFFQIVSKIFQYYSRMDNYFTDLTYIYSEENIIIKSNLELLSNFKDVARLWINNIAFEENGQLPKMLKKISSKFQIDYSNIEYYKISELTGLYNNDFVNKEEINNRKLSFVIYFSTNKLNYLTGKKALSFIEKITADEKAFSSSEVKGKVANKTHNTVKGKVRVINVDYSNLDNMNKQISKMIKGEILVSEFTAPELISACRKAKAIITDMGGMLSHAAIVSRELNIPCLIATGNASKILKTGDEIIIDFNLGSVNKT